MRISGMDHSQVDWDRLDRYIAGEGTPEELEALRRWVESDPELQVLAEVMRTAQRPPDVAPVRWDAPGSWEAVAQRLGLPREASTEHASQGRAASLARARARSVLLLAEPARASGWARFRVAAAIAAAVVSVLSADSWIRHELARREQLKPIAEASREYATLRGQRLVVHLSDQTAITLAPESRLRLSPTYGSRARDVELQGQAYFVVTHDSIRPFSVHTDRLIVRDLGTRFIVRAYPGDSTRHVVVAEGEVALGRAQAPGATASDSVLLRPGDLGRVTSAGDLTRAQGVSVDQYLAWTDGELRFRGTRLRDAVVELGRWYGVDVRLADASSGDEQVTASFRDESAPVAIGLVASAAGLVVDQNGTQYTLHRKRS